MSLHNSDGHLEQFSPDPEINEHDSAHPNLQNSIHSDPTAVPSPAKNNNALDSISYQYWTIPNPNID